MTPRKKSADKSRKPHPGLPEPEPSADEPVPPVSPPPPPDPALATLVAPVAADVMAPPPAEVPGAETALPHGEETPAGRLALSLSPAALGKLREHTQESQWTIPRLVEQVIHDSLHHAFPRITYRGVELARAGCYRGFDRVAQRPALVLKSDRGEFLLQPRQENPEFREWLAIYQKRGEPRASEQAGEMCSFSLQQKLEQFHGPDATHVIYPEDFLVEQLV